MIFTDTKLKSKIIGIRFFNFKDPNLGWGDIGTKMYASFPLSAFKEEENKRIEKAGGSYWTYKFTDDWVEKLKKTLGSHWWMDSGYELANEQKRLAELKATYKATEIAESIIKFK